MRGTELIVQNPEDFERLVNARAASRQQTSLIRGSGVNTEQFSPVPGPRSREATSVLMASRLLRSKGLADFVECAARVRVERPDVRFRVAGAVDPGNPDTVTEGELAGWARAGHVEFLGHRDDIVEVLRRCDIVVLPSHREGVPRILLEAAAMGIALVATDVPGCREIVRHGETGLLVPPADPQALAAAVLCLVRDAALRARLGANARIVAQREFDQRLVLAATRRVYARALPGIDRRPNPSPAAPRAANLGQPGD
jgi:glycosyltransferase involved in cell wall biosynthesis